MPNVRAKCIKLGGVEAQGEVRDLGVVEGQSKVDGHVKVDDLGVVKAEAKLKILA